MGGFLGGNSYVHVLLIGVQDVGKTKFLYEALLQNKANHLYKSTEGYNMECMKWDQTTYALWDLSASPEFMSLWHVFYQFVPFKITIFMVKIANQGLATLQQKHNDSIAQSRKLLHRLMTLEVFQTKPLLLLINLEKEFNQASDKQDAVNETKACLNWDDIKVKEKQAIAINVNAYLDHESVLQVIDKMYKKLEEEEENNKKDS